MKKNILIVVGGGGIKHLKKFLTEAKSLRLKVTLGSLSDVFYKVEELHSGFGLEGYIGKVALTNFDVIYIRLVGREVEKASFLINYCKDKKIKVVDPQIPLTKSLEIEILAKNNIVVPTTLFGGLLSILGKAEETFGFPFVIKSTTGKQGHEVWSPRNKGELNDLTPQLVDLENNGKNFIFQEFIESSQRTRILVIGGKAMAAITRPTRWRKRFSLEIPERKALMPVPEEDANLAETAAKVLGISIAGVDILHEQKGRAIVLEVNSAPRWQSIELDTEINVEQEILNYLIALL